MKPKLIKAFTSLWLADTAATALFVYKYGVEMEANPIMAWVLENTGYTGFILWKLITLAFWLLLSKRINIIIHWSLCIIMVPVVIAGVQVALS